MLHEHIKNLGNPGKGNVSYLSSKICKEFTQIITKEVLAEIILCIKKSKDYSTSVDSTPDISHVHQLTFIIRYVQENGKPVERFIKFIADCKHT